MANQQRSRRAWQTWQLYQQPKLWLFSGGWLTKKATGREESLGRLEIDLSELSSEVTHNLWRNLQESSTGSLHLTVTINKCEVVSTQSTKTEISEDFKSQYVREENISKNIIF